MIGAVGQTSGIIGQEVSREKNRAEHELIPPKIYEAFGIFVMLILSHSTISTHQP